MKLTITTENNQVWQFELLETSGKALDTNTSGNRLYFDCHITVALHNKIHDMSSLYRLLLTLTRNFWYGLVVRNEHAEFATLNSYSIRLPKEGESGVFICEIGYRVLMPQNTIGDYLVKLED